MSKAKGIEVSVHLYTPQYVKSFRHCECKFPSLASKAERPSTDLIYCGGLGDALWPVTPTHKADAVQGCTFAWTGAGFFFRRLPVPQILKMSYQSEPKFQIVKQIIDRRT